MAMIAFDLGDYRRAMADLQQMLTVLHGERRDHAPGSTALLAVQARAWMVRCLGQLGEFAAGVAYGNEALQIAEAAAQPYPRLAAYTRVGAFQVYQGTLHAAIPLLERAMVVNQDANFLEFYHVAASHLALAYAMAGRAPDARTMLEQVRGKIPHNPTLSLVCAEAYLRTGAVPEAAALAQQVLAETCRRKGRGCEAWAQWLLGAVAMGSDLQDVVRAAAHYQQALALAEERGMRPLQAHCHLGLGTLFATTGQREQARAELSAAITLYRAMEMRFWLPQAEAALAQVEGE
jgi:tetratricopeptide (TPR) repeat protein